RERVVSGNFAPQVSISEPKQKVGRRLDIECRSHAIFIRVEGLAIMPVPSVVTVAPLSRQPTGEIIAPLEADAILRIRIAHRLDRPVGAPVSSLINPCGNSTWLLWLLKP